MDAQTLAIVSYVSSFGCAFGFVRALAQRAAGWSRRRKLMARANGGLRLSSAVPSWSAGILSRAWRASADVTRRPPFQTIGARSLRKKLALAGLEGQVTVRGLCCARFDSALALCSAFALAGALGSVELSAVGALAGFAAGFRLPESALDAAAKARKRALEAQLSGALEAWCLGLRSGLSFDRSIALYCANFRTAFAEELSAARGEWQSGLKTREEALRSLAATYDSPLFGRVIESVVRSARFGSPLASSLEALASEARRAHRAAVQEQVMKAPVKMMIPVGTLILPSMLLLVLGPVLLELVEGF